MCSSMHVSLVLEAGSSGGEDEACIIHVQILHVDLVKVEKWMILGGQKGKKKKKKKSFLFYEKG